MPNEVTTRMPARTAEMVRKQSYEHEPFFISFTRSTVDECLKLAAHLERKGFRMFVFNENDVTVSPAGADGEFIDVKMITAYDDKGLSAAQIIRALDLGDSDTEPIVASLRKCAEALGILDWQTLTGADCARYDWRAHRA